MEVHTCGGETTTTKTGKLNEIRRIVVPGALNDTKKIRKVGADMVADVGPEQPEKLNNINKYATGDPKTKNKQNKTEQLFVSS